MTGALHGYSLPMQLNLIAVITCDHVLDLVIMILFILYLL